MPKKTVSIKHKRVYKTSTYAKKLVWHQLKNYNLLE